MSIEGVAARAGVGKTTIYRRWPSKDELVGEAIGQVHMEVPVLDSGDLRADLIAMAKSALRNFSYAGGVFLRVIGEAESKPAVFAAFREKVMVPRFAQFGARIERAVARGELRADIDIVLFVEVLAGPIFFHALVTGDLLPPLPNYAEQLIDTILQGLAPR